MSVTLDLLNLKVSPLGGSCVAFDATTGIGKFLCSKNHAWSALAQKVAGGEWCPKCNANKRKHTIEDMREVARSRGGECLSETYLGASVKLRWRCNEGHVWEATPGKVKSRTWCPDCAGVLRGDIEQMHVLALARGGECLSSQYLNRYTKISWRCAEGHEWLSAPANIVSGNWCPVCAGRAPITLSDLQQIAEKHGGALLSSNITNSHDKSLRFRCKEAHEWITSATVVRGGSWCPTCARTRVHKLLALPFSEVAKTAEALNAQYISGNYVNCNSVLHWKCNQGHQWAAAVIQLRQGKGCPTCSKVVHLFALSHRSFCEAKSTAIKRGFELLTSESEYVNATTPCRWRCESGHEWKTAPSCIRAGTGCPDCSRKRKGTIEEMQRLAAEHRGLCLSTEYVNTHTPLEWKCEAGHTFSAEPKRIRAGHWCRSCRSIEAKKQAA